LTSSGGTTPVISATYQGNGAKVQASTGSTTTNDCVKFDTNGNTVDAGAACGTGSSAFSQLPSVSCTPSCTAGTSQIVLSGATATLTFASIPATFSQLDIAIDGASSNASANDSVLIQLNGVAGYARAINFSTQANDAIVGFLNGASGPANSSGRVHISIFNYARTTFIKRYHSDYGTTSGSNINSPLGGSVDGTMQTLTAAVTSISFTLTSGGNFITGSVVTLYGVL
jgi:hypothetical protein